MIYAILIGDCDPEWEGFLEIDEIMPGNIIDTTEFVEPGDSVYQVIGYERLDDQYLVTVTEIDQ